jgi:hypothetical protein
MVKRKNLPVVLFFLLHAFTLQAQYNFLRPDYSSLSFHEFYPAKRNLTLSTEYYAASTAITNKFFNYYFLGKFIDTELKNDVSERLNDNDNRLGSGVSATLM